MPDGTEGQAVQSGAQVDVLKERGFENVDALLADRDKIAEERDHFKEHNEKAQKIIQRQGSELGELRKKVGNTAVQSGSNGQVEGSEPESLEQLEQSLTPEQRKAAEEAFAAASEEEKLAFVNNPESRKALLATAKTVVRSVPQSLFGGPTVKSGQSQGAIDAEKIKALFNKEKGRSTYYPTRTNGGLPPASQGEAPEPRRPVGQGGVLEAIKRRTV